MSYREEYPNPQFERKNWINLNGVWRFAFDFGKSGMERNMFRSDAGKYYDRSINVPFCPESRLSGIEYKDFINAVWYQRDIILTDTQLTGRTWIHFGAVDYETHVFVNDTEVGKHTGGFSSFAFDITDNVRKGENTITVYAVDEVRSSTQPRGKQAETYQPTGCDYTRTTGIWQTVWLEFVPENYIEDIKYYPDIKNKCFHIDCRVHGKGILNIKAFYEGKICGNTKSVVSGNDNRLRLDLDELHLWECGNGRLYDIVFEYNSNGKCDYIKSYCGMRQVEIEGYKFLLNGKCIFQRMVLDQGFYRNGIYTAPTDEALLEDIRLSKALGFNGARLHQKIFEPRFLYHCDREGYLVWGEHGSWGLDLSDPAAFLNFMPEWMEAVNRDFNHPSIIGWCPFNETWDYDGKKQNDRILEIIYRLTKMLDSTRPCIDTSGNFHVMTDIYDLHNYRQDVKAFSDCYREFPDDTQKMEEHATRQRYKIRQPLFISEYGGIKWNTALEYENAWGYGEEPKTENEFIARYKGLTESLLNHPYIMGFCYTQLYDVEQETNGLYDYDRNPKFNVKEIYQINSAQAAIEADEADSASYINNL